MGVEGEESVSAQAAVAVAQRWQNRYQFLERRGQVQDQVIVAESLVLNEINSH
jgi:hypothetical protein